MIIDAHAHLEEELSVAGTIAAMDEAGIARSVLIAAAQEPVPPFPAAGPAIMRGCMSVPALRMPMYRIARATMKQKPRPDNEGVFAAARAHPDRFLPFAFVNPLLPDAREELERRLAEGARGVKLHLWFHRYRLPDALAVLRMAEQNGLPVLAHLGFGPAEDVRTALEAAPKLKLVLAHAGIPHYERLWEEPRLFFDVAAPQLTSKRTIARLLDAVGPARVLFGSDSPVGIRKGKTHRHDPPALPSRCYGDTFAALLP